MVTYCGICGVETDEKDVCDRCKEEWEANDSRNRCR